MTNKVGQVEPLIDGCLHATLPDARCVEFNVKPFIRSDFFVAPKSTEYFCHAGLFFSGVGWRDAQDLGPDTIQASLRARGSIDPAPVPDTPLSALCGSLTESGTFMDSPVNIQECLRDEWH